MENKPVIVEIPGFIQNKVVKKVAFTLDGLTIEKPLSFDPPVFIPAKDIAAFRYGVKWISGYQFTIGRVYVIEIKDINDRVFSIKLNSYYRIKSKIYHKIWLDLLDHLWKSYWVEKLNHYYSLYKNKQVFELAGVIFESFGISWSNGSLSWDEIALSNYQTYFMIHHRDDVRKNYSRNFMNDWNALLLQALLQVIIEEYDVSKAKLA
ncbi:MAG: hypothetical protein JST32_02125 [Bacteroidetes bacterium]|nr:hypothetical protein [Bacteroidota bacterium]